MKLNPIAAACAFATLALAQGAARADEGGAQLKVSGYGTVAAVMTNDSDRQFIGDITRTVGATNKPDIGQDSRFGLQGVVTFQNNFSITGQIVAQRRLAQGGAIGSDKDLSPAVDWLYAQYDATPELNVRLGRMALPTYLLSDSLRVGYAANWLRAPIHLYTSEPFNYFDGLELNYKRSFGGYNVSVQALHGKSEAMLLAQNNLSNLKSDNVNGVNVIVEHGNWLGRVGLVRVKVPFATQGTTVGIDDSYLSLGGQYDDGQLIVMSEFARRSQTKLAIAGGKAVAGGQYGYVAAGWRLGKFLPLAMYSEDGYTTHFPVGGGHTFDSKAHAFAPSLSLRYDVAPNIALKAQVDRYKANDARAFRGPVSPDNHKVNVYSAGVDFVF